MWMPTAVRRAIFRSLFENGVLVVSSNQSAKHEELGCLNIYPFQVGRSFVSKGFCKKQYAWSHIYYTLTNEGIEYLRNFFGAPPNVMPATMQPRDKSALLEGPREGRSFGRGGRGGFRRDGERRERPEGEHREGGFRRGFRGHKEEGETPAAAPAQE